MRYNYRYIDPSLLPDPCAPLLPARSPDVLVPSAEDLFALAEGFRERDLDSALASGPPPSRSAAGLHGRVFTLDGEPYSAAQSHRTFLSVSGASPDAYDRPHVPSLASVGASGASAVFCSSSFAPSAPAVLRAPSPSPLPSVLSSLAASPSFAVPARRSPDWICSSMSRSAGSVVPEASLVAGLWADLRDLRRVLVLRETAPSPASYLHDAYYVDGSAPSAGRYQVVSPPPNAPFYSASPSSESWTSPSPSSSDWDLSSPSPADPLSSWGIPLLPASRVPSVLAVADFEILRGGGAPAEFARILLPAGQPGSPSVSASDLASAGASLGLPAAWSSGAWSSWSASVRVFAAVALPDWTVDPETDFPDWTP